MGTEPVAGLMLAAGAGRRYGRPEALVEYDGGLLVDRAADTLRAAGRDPVMVVLGAAADQVRALPGSRAPRWWRTRTGTPAWARRRGWGWPR